MEHLTAAAVPSESIRTHRLGGTRLTNQPTPDDEYRPTHGLPVQQRFEFGRGGLLEQAREMCTESQDRIRDLEARVGALEQRLTADQAEARVEAAFADGEKGARARHKTALDAFSDDLRDEIREELNDEHQRVLRDTHDFYETRLAEATTAREELEAKLRERVEKPKQRKRSPRAKRARILVSSPAPSKIDDHLHQLQHARPSGHVDEDVKYDFGSEKDENRASQGGFDALVVPSSQHAFAEIDDNLQDVKYPNPSGHTEESMEFEPGLPRLPVPTSTGKSIEEREIKDDATFACCCAESAGIWLGGLERLECSCRTYARDSQQYWHD